MERLFQILAVILAGIAAYFLWNGNNDAGFITVVFGAVSFFLSIRFQVKERLDQRKAEREAAEELAVGSGSRQLSESNDNEILTTEGEQRTAEKESL
jgi:hypothetical protein